MKNLNYELKQRCRRNRDGSFATQADREGMLALIATQLDEMGYRDMRMDSLRKKHVTALVNRWEAEGLSDGTIKNRMNAMRWWASKIGKENVIDAKNKSYGIGNRAYIPDVSKAKVILAEQKALVTDDYTAKSLWLQEAFGMRREESIKIIPSWADKGNMLRLKASWTKGGRYREIPITTAAQRAALDAAISLAKGGSLIPANMNYKAQLQRFRAQCDKAGICGVHGLRHKYAQTRYAVLTGWNCPLAGGPRSKQLTAKQKLTDRMARMTISAELRHGREQITTTYLGR